jgi:hypothetical protein
LLLVFVFLAWCLLRAAARRVPRPGEGIERGDVRDAE